MISQLNLRTFYVTELNSAPSPRLWKLHQTKPTLLLGVGGPDPVDGLAAQVRVDAGVLGLGGQLGQVSATLAAVLTSRR